MVSEEAFRLEYENKLGYGRWKDDGCTPKEICDTARYIVAVLGYPYSLIDDPRHIEVDEITPRTDQDTRDALRVLDLFDTGNHQQWLLEAKTAVQHGIEPALIGEGTRTGVDPFRKHGTLYNVLIAAVSKFS